MNRYSNIPIFKTPTGRRYYANVKYPEIPYSDNDIYIVAQEGDRFDLLAYTYYNDATLWWVIPSANPRFKPNSLYPVLGHQIRIPANVSDVISNFESLNQ